MKVTMFLSPSESFEGKYFGEIAWAYYVLENEELLSTTMDTRQEVYENKELDQYVTEIKEIYKKQQYK